MLQPAFVIYELAWESAFLFVVRNAILQWGKGKTAAFFLPAIFFGFLLEWALQTLYHGYHYGNGFLLYVLNVPLSVCLTWATVLYLGYWLAKEKLKLEKPWQISAAAAVVLVAIDALHFEPMAHTFGFWIWRNPGPWFGAQWDNFYLWFWVAFLYLSAFQWIDAQKWSHKKKLAINTLLVPGYAIVLVALLHAYGIISQHS